MKFLKLLFMRIKKILSRDKTDLDKSLKKIDHEDPYIYE